MAIEKKPHRNKKFNKLLVEQFKGVQVAMADALEISPSLVSRYASGSKGIGEDMKNLIEEKLKLKKGWFDTEDDREIFETSNTKKQDLIKFILSLPDDEVDEQRVTLIKYSGLIDKRFVDGSARILHEINQPERKYDAKKTEESTKEGNGE